MIKSILFRGKRKPAPVLSAFNPIWKLPSHMFSGDVWWDKISAGLKLDALAFERAIKQIHKEPINIVLVGDMHLDAMRVHKVISDRHTLAVLSPIGRHNVTTGALYSLDQVLPTFIKDVPSDRPIRGQSPRQDPYDLCNCDSGKRYRKCCGRGRNW